ncbi:MAG: cytochrome c biogenesis protein ResB [Acidobacteriota bacterium]|nr:cytochrome c biogenesis protein ResB [Acidobacteriota bacterium]NLH71183.1 cytochrome c biogenesis protein ResB [Brooklawnia sp.]
MSLDTDERTGPAATGKGDDPVDGLDGTLSVAPAKLFGSIYAFFYNKRVGLVLILLTGLIALIGVLFPQAPSGVMDDPASRQAWLESVRPTFGGWSEIMATLGFFNVFSSIPFVVLMVLLAVSTMACTFHRVPLLYKTAFHPHTRVSAEFFNRARLNSSFTSPGSVDEMIATIKADARSNRARVIEDERGPGRNLYTDKWHLAPFGTAAAHIGIVVIMAGFLLSSLTGFRDDQFTLTIGHPTEVGHGTGLVAEAKSFVDSYYDNGAPKDYVTDLVLTRDGQQVARQEVRVNEPLSYDGIMFHQAYFGVAAVMQITDAHGQVIFRDGVPLEWTTKDGSMTYGVLQVPGHDRELFVIGSASGRTDTGIAPGQMRIEVYPGGEDVPLGTAILDQGGYVDVDGLTYTFEREQQFTGLLVKRDPGVGVVWLGSALLILGTCLTLLLRHHRIWFRVTETDDGSLVQMASPDRQDATFARRFGELAAKLSDKMSGPQGRINPDA